MLKNKIKILQVIDEAKIGGGQIHVLLLTKYLNRDIFDVYVACEKEGYLVDELKKIGIPVLPLSITNKLKISNLIDIVKLFEKNNFDIVHTHGGTAGFWGRIPKVFLKNKPIIVHTFHGLHYLNLNLFKKSTFILIDRWLNRITDMNIYVCKSDFIKGIKNKLSYDTNSVVINNGIDIENYSKPVNREYERSKFLFKDYFVFGNVGRLHKQKGQEYLIKAFAMLYKKYPDVLLAIVGDGELKKDLMKLSSDLGVCDRVLFLGSRTDVNNFLQSIDVFVLSSLWEGQPLTVFEAMAAAKPIIATDVDGVSEILIDQKNALMCSPSNPVSLSLTMERLYNDRSLADRIAKEAQNNVMNTYSAQSTAMNISNLYLFLYSKLKNKE